MESRGDSRLLAVLKIKPFRALWTAQVLTQVAVNMLVFILGVIIYGKTRSNTAVALLYLTVGLPSAFFGVVSGVLVDRERKRQVLLYSTLIRAILVGLIFFLREHLFFLYFLVALISIVSQFFVPAEASLIPRFVPSTLLLSANSLFSLTFYSAIIGGFVAGGPLLEMTGEPTVLVILTMTFVLSWLILLQLPESEKKTVRLKLTLPQLFTDLRAAFVYLNQLVRVKQAILLLTLVQAIVAVIATLGPGFADRILLIKLTDASLAILGPATVGMVIGALFVGSWGARFRKRHLIRTGIFTSSLCLLLVAILIRSRRHPAVGLLFEEIFSTSFTLGLLPVSVICFFILGFASSLIEVTGNTVVQESTHKEMRGRVYGILQSLIGGVAILPVVVSGIVADLFGVGKIIFLLGLTLFFCGVYIARVKPEKAQLT